MKGEINMIEKISAAESREAGVSSLASRPNTNSRYGVSGLTAAELRHAFDSLALLAIAKLNEVIDYINGSGAEEDTPGSGTGGSGGISGDITLQELSSLLAGKADKEHNHDGRYYTSTSLDFLLETLLPKKPDGTNPLIGTDGKIAGSYLPTLSGGTSGGTSGVASVNGKSGAVMLGAADIGVDDSAGSFTAVNVETVLAEIASKLSDLSSKVNALSSVYHKICGVGDEIGIEYSDSSPTVTVLPENAMSYYDDGGVIMLRAQKSGECTVTFKFGEAAGEEVYRILICPTVK